MNDSENCQSVPGNNAQNEPEDPEQRYEKVSTGVLSFVIRF
ncbi:MAG: hypothetical protein R6W70_09170 [bacterium]